MSKAEVVLLDVADDNPICIEGAAAIGLPTHVVQHHEISAGQIRSALLVAS